ncbi:FkbM family methyltransferase [[Phormidium] sp. ETS-05]|uniref:FkbM family methyltransferase n=1 Tax=[Phormidium] sp. ETS-05 TaxID=222819 RepID=UPI0018EF0EF0|nr:FkbM family methyltransferase [[Phormidium] sp. ETS-05]
MIFQKIKTILSQDKPTKYLVGRILWKSGLCRLFKIQRDGYCLHFSPSALSATLWVYPYGHQTGEENFFKHYLKVGDRVIDIGGNIGVLAIRAALSVGSKGQVYSVEPHPRIYQYLLKNIKLNKLENVQTFNYAMGESSEDSIIFSQKPDDSQNQVIKNGQGISIPMKKLDDLPIKESEIHLLKIDVEGYEKFVLEGASQIISKIQCIYFESWEYHFTKFGYHTSDVIKLLIEKGFQCFRMLDDSTVTSISLGYASENCENLIAVKDINSFLERTGFTYK